MLALQVWIFLAFFKLILSHLPLAKSYLAVINDPYFSFIDTYLDLNLILPPCFWLSSANFQFTSS